MDSTHKDHRKRLKNKMRKFGAEVFENHEFLELLLTYTIPRKDTNPIGHALLEHFGSFHEVIDADYHDLQKVKGIGPESATFINILSALVEFYNKSKANEKANYITNTQIGVQFFRDNFSIKSNEFMVLVCLNKNKKVIKTNVYKGHSPNEIAFDLKQILNKITDIGVSSVILFHTHPSGDVLPSEQDIATTQNILNLCLLNGVDFEDHIILNEAEHYSFSKNKITDKLKIKYAKFVSTNNIYYDTLIQSVSQNKNKEEDERK